VTVNQSGWKPTAPIAATSDGATTTGNRALMLEEPLIFEIGDSERPASISKPLVLLRRQERWATQRSGLRRSTA
jgi:hypothetical protein